jgi:hypothetical protein
LPRIIRTPTIIAVALAAAAALGTGPAGAGPGKASINSKITISDRETLFHGRVLADTKACENLRRAKLYLEKQDHNKLLGKDTTNGKLRWTIELKPERRGAYFAKVIDQRRGGNNCQSDKTRTIVIN